MNAKVGVVLLVVPLGPEVIVVSGAVVSAAGLAATVSGFIVLSVSPVASVIERRTYLTPSPWNVNVIVLPSPSGHCRPPVPSGPSSSHVYVHGVSPHVALDASNETAWPMVGAGRA